MFGVRIFAPVFLIASFFFMGSPGTAKAIFGEGAKGLLFDLGQALANAVPLSRVPVAIVQAIVGGITGLDGSGFSGLPLVGTLAQALGGPTQLDIATLGAFGQYFAVVEIARRNRRSRWTGSEWPRASAQPARQN